MKKILFLTLNCFISVICFSQNVSVLRHAAREEREMIQLSQSREITESFRIDSRDTNSEHSQNIEKCRKFMLMKRKGLGLTVGGGVALSGGIALFVYGISNSFASTRLDVTEVVLYSMGGIASAIIGIGLSGAGIPLTIIGYKNSKKYCNHSSANLSLGIEKHGPGLCLTF